MTVPADTPASDNGSGWHDVRGIVRIYNLCLFGELGERDLVIVVLLCVSLTSNEIRHLFICFFAGQLFPSVEQPMESSERFQTFGVPRFSLWVFVTCPGRKASLGSACPSDTEMFSLSLQGIPREEALEVNVAKFMNFSCWLKLFVSYLKLLSRLRGHDAIILYYLPKAWLVAFSTRVYKSPRS